MKRSFGIELPQKLQTPDKKYRSCDICDQNYNKIREPLCLAKCGHGICFECFEKLSGSCPFCREKISHIPSRNMDLLQENDDFEKDLPPASIKFSQARAKKIVKKWTGENGNNNEMSNEFQFLFTRYRIPPLEVYGLNEITFMNEMTDYFAMNENIVEPQTQVEISYFQIFDMYYVLPYLFDRMFLPNIGPNFTQSNNLILLDFEPFKRNFEINSRSIPNRVRRAMLGKTPKQQSKILHNTFVKFGSYVNFSMTYFIEEIIMKLVDELDPEIEFYVFVRHLHLLYLPAQKTIPDVWIQTRHALSYLKHFYSPTFANKVEEFSSLIDLDIIVKKISHLYYKNWPDIVDHAISNAKRVYNSPRDVDTIANFKIFLNNILETNFEYDVENTQYFFNMYILLPFLSLRENDFRVVNFPRNNMIDHFREISFDFDSDNRLKLLDALDNFNNDDKDKILVKTFDRIIQNNGADSRVFNTFFFVDQIIKQLLKIYAEKSQMLLTLTANLDKLLDIGEPTLKNIHEQTLNALICLKKFYKPNFVDHVENIINDFYFQSRSKKIKLN